MFRLDIVNGSLIIYVSKNDSRELRTMLRAASQAGFESGFVDGQYVRIVRVSEEAPINHLTGGETAKNAEIAAGAKKPKISVGVDKGQGFEASVHADTMLHLIEAVHKDNSRTVIMASHNVIDVIIWWADRKTKSVKYAGSKIVMHTIPCPTAYQTLNDVKARLMIATAKEKT